jgi:phytol kinase
MQAYLGDILLSALALFLVPLSFSIGLLAHSWGGAGGPAVRRAIHLSSGCFILFVPLFPHPIFPILVCLAISAFVALMNEKSRFLKGYYDMLAEGEELELGYLQGPLAFAAALTAACVLMALFPENRAIYIASILAMVLGDPFAAYVGGKFGRHRFKVGRRSSPRSLEGTLAMLLATILACLAVSLFYPGLSASRIAALSVIATAVEAVSPGKWDDFLIPTLTSLLMFLFL